MTPRTLKITQSGHTVVESQGHLVESCSLMMMTMMMQVDDHLSSHKATQKAWPIYKRPSASTEGAFRQCIIRHRLGHLNNKKIQKTNNNFILGESPGLLVMGGDSCSKGCGFKSQHHILDGHFFTFICCKNCNFCLKRQK